MVSEMKYGSPTLKVENYGNLGVDPNELSMGIDVEMEHTNDRKVARQIAVDHLKEDPKYYTKLQVMESKKDFQEKGIDLEGLKDVNKVDKDKMQNVIYSEAQKPMEFKCEGGLNFSKAMPAYATIYFPSNKKMDSFWENNRQHFTRFRGHSDPFNKTYYAELQPKSFDKEKFLKEEVKKYGGKWK